MDRLSHARSSGWPSAWRDVDSPPDVIIVNCRLDVVDLFIYLGSTISSTLCLDTEFVNARIAKAAAVMARLSKRVWQNSQLTENTKLRVYQACVLSTPLYSSNPLDGVREEREAAQHLPSALSQTYPAHLLVGQSDQLSGSPMCWHPKHAHAALLRDVSGV